MTEPPRRPLAFRIWLAAARPKTLPVSISPVVVGTGLAWRDHHAYWPAAVAALIGAMLIQIGTNFANDLFDYERGADAHDRQGPLRVRQAGWASTRQMQFAMMIVFAAAILVGAYLATHAGWPIVAIGLASIVAAILYTGGPYPFGYHGWGEIFVFIFFGPVAVVGTYYVQSLTAGPAAWIAAMPMGALAAAVLVVNNRRDIETDRRTGKRTLAVRLGRRGSAWEYLALWLVAFVTPLAMYGTGRSGPGILLPAIAALAGLPTVRRMFSFPEGSAANRLLAATAALQAIYALAFAIGVNL
ncbi:MAG: 1,4-dihydroxy-2-naphthoate polyprenyltransferase [candidate division Zixibacteria bacterium]|nr:1,4-dihydroxy-2-naphthoate polyprenyltransferase [candidate division Zixibacteria bacterium]